MTYMLDSQGEVVHCEECEQYPAECEHHNPETDEWTSLCIECVKGKKQEDITYA